MWSIVSSLGEFLLLLFSSVALVKAANYRAHCGSQRGVHSPQARAVRALTGDFLHTGVETKYVLPFGVYVWWWLIH